MNGYIYKIVNDINDKVYIGQTRTSIHKRWHAHLTRYASGDKKGIYGAMKKYGINHFSIQAIVECPVEELNDLEIFYIKKYNSYYNGYNLTIGGDGKSTLDLDEQEVIDKYKELKYVTDTAKFFNCCSETISNILHKNNIKIELLPKFNIKNVPRSSKSDLANAKQICIVELNKTFPSLIECGRWLIENNYCNTKKPDLAQRSISRVLNGDRKTYCKFHYKYI